MRYLICGSVRLGVDTARRLGWTPVNRAVLEFADSEKQPVRVLPCEAHSLYGMRTDRVYIGHGIPTRSDIIPQLELMSKQHNVELVRVE